MFIQRNDAGKIIGINTVLQPGVAEEFLDDDDPEILTFEDEAINPPGDDYFFKRTDSQMARMTEDILVTIATIGETRQPKRSDFPDCVWNKINTRRLRRGQSSV